MTASVINYPSGIITTIGTTVRLKALPFGTRVLPTFTVTALAPAAQTFTTTASVSAGGTSIPVSSVPVALKAGTQLTFSSVTVTVVANTAQTANAATLSVAPVSGSIASAATASYTPAANAIGNTIVFVSPTPVFLDAGEVLSFGGTSVTLTDPVPAGSRVLFCRALIAAVTANATASTLGLVNLVGCTDASPSSAPKTIDTTNYLSGVGVEMATIGTNRTLNVTFNEIQGDLGGIIIKNILFNNDHFNREVYAVVARPNGEKYEGAAIVTSGDGQAPVQEKVTRSAAMQFQGASFIYTPPTSDATIAASIMAS